MGKSKRMQVDVDCQKMGIKNFPIAGYPFTVYKKNFEQPIYHQGEQKLRRPSMPIHVEACASPPVGVYSVPRYRLNCFDKYVEVPVIQKVAKVVEIPEVREITKYVDVVKVVDVPVEQVRMIPKLKIREIEKIRHVPGPVEFVDVPQEVIVHKPRKEIVEKIYEIPVIEDIEVEVPFYVPTPVGPPEEIRIEVPLPYDVPQFCYKPERTFPSHIPIPLHHVANHGFYRSNEYETDEKEYYDEQNVPLIIPSQRNLSHLHSSPPLGSYVVNENDPHQNFKRAEEDEQMDELLYSYNKQYKNNTHSKTFAKNTPTKQDRRNTANDINCFNTYNRSINNSGRSHKIRENNEHVNEIDNNVVHTYRNNQNDIPSENYTTLPADDQYYYSYNVQNQDPTNYSSNEETDFYSCQRNGDRYYPYTKNDTENTYDEKINENLTENNIYTAQEQIDDGYFNNVYGNIQNDNRQNYYGNECNYIYNEGYIESPTKKNSKKQYAELIVKKRNRRFH